MNVLNKRLALLEPILSAQSVITKYDAKLKCHFSLQAYLTNIPELNECLYFEQCVLMWLCIPNIPTPKHDSYQYC